MWIIYRCGHSIVGDVCARVTHQCSSSGSGSTEMSRSLTLERALLAIEKLRTQLDRQEQYSAHLRRVLYDTHMLNVQQRSVLNELLAALLSADPARAVGDKRDSWLTTIELQADPDIGAFVALLAMSLIDCCRLFDGQRVCCVEHATSFSAALAAVVALAAQSTNHRQIDQQSAVAVDESNAIGRHDA